MATTSINSTKTNLLDSSATLGTKSNPKASKTLRFPSDIGNYPLTALYIYKVKYQQSKDLNKISTFLNNGINKVGGALQSGLQNISDNLTNLGVQSGGISKVKNNIIPGVKKGAGSFVDQTATQLSLQKSIEEKYQLYLPLPMDVNVTYSQNWSGAELSAFQYVLREAAKNGFNNANMQDIAKKGTMFGMGELTKNLLASKGVSAGGVGQGAGFAFNPYRALLYSAPEFRTFSLEWVLSPKNAQESNVLNEMIWILKKHSYPSTLNNEDISESLYIEYPEYCNIEFWSNETSGINPYFFKFDDCAITSISVREETKLHRDTNAPAAVSITINFLESKILTQRDFGDEYQQNTQYF